MNLPSNQDQHYARVQSALQPQVVQDLLNERLAGRSQRIESLKVDYSFYVPGNNFRIVYRGDVVNGVSRDSQVWFGRIPVAEDHQQRYEKIQHKLEKGRYVQPALGQAAYHLPEIGMVLWTFPNDPHLKTLPELLRAATLQRIFRSFEHRQNWDLGAHHYDMARYIPGKRCVLRFQIEWRGPRPRGDIESPGPSDTFPALESASELETVFGKVYESAAASAVAWSTLQDLWKASQQHKDFFRIPTPLHCEEPLQTLWMARVPGEALALRASAVTVEMAAGIGRGLGLLQLSPIRTFTRYTLEQECAATRDNGLAVAAIHPEMQPQIDEIVAALQRQLKTLARLPLVPSHGTFKLNHLMSDGGPLSLLDFDSMTAADPLFDVANFTSDVYYLEAQGDLPEGRAATLAGALQEAYFSTVPWGRRQRTLDWYVASLLLRKQAYKTVKHLHGDAVAKIGNVVQEALRRTRRLDS